MNIHLIFTGLIGLSGVIIDGARAHAIDHLTPALMTATEYHRYYALVLLALTFAMMTRPNAVWVRHLKWCFWIFVTGLIVFCGTLYLKTFTDITLFNKLTPFGGVTLMLGWLGLLITGLVTKVKAND